MFAARPLLGVLRQASFARCCCSALAPRRNFFHTARIRAEEAKLPTAQENGNSGSIEEIPKEILDEVPQEVHEEMKELGRAYDTQIQKMMASPEVVAALKEIKKEVEAMGA